MPPDRRNRLALFAGGVSDRRRDAFRMLKWTTQRADGGAMKRRKPNGERVLRVGIDLVEIDAVASTLDSALADRYLARIYTPAEVRDCSDANGVSAARLAARFAAKEAVMKALDVGNRAIPWRAIEVRRQQSGRPTVSLHGAAAAIAREEGVAQFALSLSHEAGCASAVVVATP
jgi:holo-[acyl-carrier protein] synthase